MNAEPRHLDLMARYADGSATSEEVRELELALVAEAALRREMVRYLNVDSALSAVASAIDLQPDSTSYTRILRRWWWLAPLAAAAVIVLLMWRPWGRVESKPLASPATSPGVPPAVLVAATHARWADADVELSLRSGDLPDAPFRLESGVAEFRFTDGATALVLGPATVRFSIGNQLFLQEGRLLCRCPTPASRVTVITPATRVVDLGTEFAVDVSPDRPDTRLAVVSGEVRVGMQGRQVLRTGQAAEVGPDQVVRLTPLPPASLGELLEADNARSTGMAATDGNLLLDPTFSIGLAGPWRCTEGHAGVAPTPNGQAMTITANGHRFWPSARQKIDTGDIAGRLVVASVVACTPGLDPLTERQAGILKVVFLDAQAREFATASRHFLHAGSTAMVIDQPVTSQVAAFAPPGTRGVEVQLLLSARGRSTGTIEYTSPRLVVLPVVVAPTH